MHIFINDPKLQVTKSYGKKYKNTVSFMANSMSANVIIEKDISSIMANYILQLYTESSDLIVLHANPEMKLISSSQIIEAIDIAREKLKNPDYRFSITLQAHQIQPLDDLFNPGNKNINNLKEIQFKNDQPFINQLKAVQQCINMRIFLNLKIFELVETKNGLQWEITKVNTIRIYSLDSNEIQQVPGQISSKFNYFVSINQTNDKQLSHTFELLSQLNDTKVDVQKEQLQRNVIVEEKIYQIANQDQLIDQQQEIDILKEKLNIERSNKQRLARELEESRQKVILLDRSQKQLTEQNEALRNDLYNEREKVKYKLTKFKKMEEENIQFHQNEELNGMEYNAHKDQQSKLIQQLRCDNLDVHKQLTTAKENITDLKENLQWTEDNYQSQRQIITELKAQLNQILVMK
ncbi:hypothetical protein SS50377_27557 [Spironucleus salmonicida]|uniref:Uncharacterized protein n=1 Tax=Spironucleus salmonicida TaxID=348837 RepID=V6LQ14_9EUKA|nr:hypothetical protein SS50377_27557 [Spironucleus salmonicida]|eukprot:EST46665.1 Hypothetical protein SS50377_13470 [Spironucleus salmonicida]